MLLTQSFQSREALPSAECWVCGGEQVRLGLGTASTAPREAVEQTRNCDVDTGLREPHEGTDPNSGVGDTTDTLLEEGASPLTAGAR